VLCGGTHGVVLAGPGEGLCDVRERGADHHGIDTPQRKAIAGPGFHMTTLRADCGVCAERGQRARYTLLFIGAKAAVVNEGANGYQLRQFHDAAHVVRMEVGD
jgi:hypothetical protein